MLLMSSTNLSSHTGRHNKQFFHSAAGNAKIYLKNYNIIPRLTLLMETFIHTYHRSFTVLSDKSIYTVSLPWKLSDFLDTSFSWTLPFLGHFLFLDTFFSWTLPFLGHFLFLDTSFSWTLSFLGHFLFLDTSFSWTLSFLGHFLFLDTSFSWTLSFLGHFLFLDTFFSWTLSFPQGPYFSSFCLGTVPYIYFTFLSSWVSNPPIQLG